MGSVGIRSHTDTAAKEDFMQVGYKESVTASLDILAYVGSQKGSSSVRDGNRKDVKIEFCVGILVLSH